MDEKLLAELDAQEEVVRKGRSAVLRQAAWEYLERQKRATVAEQYRHAYASEETALPDFAGWEEEGTWPEE